jgi:hypothetical protein
MRTDKHFADHRLAILLLVITVCLAIGSLIYLAGQSSTTEIAPGPSTTTEFV